MYFDEEDRDEPEPKTVETYTVEPGPCVTCGKPDQRYGCYVCGKPVCMNEQDYWSDTACGGWILDTWHPAHPEDNEYYCNACLKAEYGDEQAESE